MSFKTIRRQANDIENSLCRGRGYGAWMHGRDGCSEPAPLNIDKTRTSVSGLSSGGFMAE